MWDHIFLGKPAPANCAVPPELLARMRREFEYWYPFDLRVSGKVRKGLQVCGLGLVHACMSGCICVWGWEGGGGWRWVWVCLQA